MGDIKVMVDGGKASAGAPLGPALGPTGVDIGKVVAKINEKTAKLEGMKVPVTIEINDDNSFEVKVGLPPTSALIKKEINVKKGSGTAGTENVGNMTMDQINKIVETKKDVLNSSEKKAMAKEIIGACVSMGVTVESMNGRDAIEAINKGKFDDKF